MDKKLLTPVEFSARTKISLNRIYRYLKEGTIKAVHVQNGSRIINMIPEEEILKYKKRIYEKNLK